MNPVYIGAPTSLAKKEQQLRLLVRQATKILVAFSGGVDSSLLAVVARQELGKNTLVALANSPSLASESLKEAQEFAAAFGLDLRLVDTTEHNDDDYLRNGNNRCFHCKKNLYGHLKALATQKGFVHITDGSHVDDFCSADRPGNQALKQFGVRSLLREAGFRKHDIRQLARQQNLPNHDKPADACLASRFLTGAPIDLNKMKVVAKAERFLRRQGMRTVRLRVGVGQQPQKTLLELDQGGLALFRSHEANLRERLASLGFNNVQLSQTPIVR